MVVITLVVGLLIGFFLLDDVIVDNVMIVDSNIMSIKEWYIGSCKRL